MDGYVDLILFRLGGGGGMTADVSMNQYNVCIHGESLRPAKSPLSMHSVTTNLFYIGEGNGMSRKIIAYMTTVSCMLLNL